MRLKDFKNSTIAQFFNFCNDYLKMMYILKNYKMMFMGYFFCFFKVGFHNGY